MIELKPVLDRLYSNFNHADSATDPIQIVRRFARDDDREIVGFIAAALAFGRVASVLQSIERVLAVMGPAPAAYVRGVRSGARSRQLRRHRPPLDSRSGHRRAALGAAPDDRPRRFDRGVFSRGRRSVRRGRRRCARQLFDPRAGAGPEDRLPPRAETRRASDISFRDRRPDRAASASTSSCAGWCAATPSISVCGAASSPSRLIVPLDTHVIRVGRCLRLTTLHQSRLAHGRATSPRSLRRLDADDPVKYDFSVCHLGMMNACGFSRPQADAQCPLRGACRPRQRPRKSQRSTRKSQR